MKCFLLIYKEIIFKDFKDILDLQNDNLDDNFFMITYYTNQMEQMEQLDKNGYAN